MGSNSLPDKYYGTVRYGEPDQSIPASERMLYSLAANKHVEDVKVALHDFRTCQDIERGPGGLDVQGFTYVSHKSALSGDQWFEGTNAEEIYVPEVLELICKVTGASRAAVDGVGFRRAPPSTTGAGTGSVVMRKGCELDLAIARQQKDQVRVNGRELKSSLEPAQVAHVDYSVQGLLDTARYARKEIVEVARNTIDEEDAGGKPRYAAYSVWRPLETVKRDPLAALDYRALGGSELVRISSRALSNVRKDGEYIREALFPTPPTDPEALRWYWMPEQTPDEVLILKFADTAAVEGSGIAAHAVHVSPKIEGNENEPPRQSVECRVLAFWD